MSQPRLLGQYRLLSTEVAIHVDDERVRESVSAVLQQFEVPGDGGRALVVVAEGGGFRGTLDGRPFLQARDARACVTHLVWRLNELVAETPVDRLVVHASAAARDGRALLFPGHSGAGKSTLVAGLVRDGWSYLTDELAVIPIGTTVVEPYPRSITLEQGSWAAFPELEGQVVRAIDQWFVPPDRLRPGCVEARTLPVGGIVFPVAQPGAGTSVRRLPRAEALVRIARQAVNLAEHGPAGFQTLSQIVREVPICAEVTGGTVPAAVEAVTELSAP